MKQKSIFMGFITILSLRMALASSPKCGSAKIECKDDKFSYSDSRLSFSCFGGQNE